MPTLRNEDDPEDDDDEDDAGEDGVDDNDDDEEPPMIDARPLNFALTHQSLTVSDGGRSYNIQRGAANYAALVAALETKDWAAAREHLVVRTSLKQWANGRFMFTPDNKALLFDGKAVPESFNRRVLEMAAKNESPLSLFRFYERLQKNPSWRSVTQLFDFLMHSNIPITPSGMFLAYKGVTADYEDVHSSTCYDKTCGHKTYDNRPGNTNKEPRNEISDDPAVACHRGLHVGSHRYAVNFGVRVVVCIVDPENVVCVPQDCSQQKVRVCEYSVVGHYGEPLPSTVMEEPVVPAIKTGSEFGDLPTAEELMEQYGIEELRYMAVHDFHIIGAGHIKGGKAAVVAAIMQVIAGSGNKNK